MRGRWFALLATGDLIAMGNCGNFERAEEVALDLADGTPIIWILDEQTAKQLYARLGCNLNL